MRIQEVIELHVDVSVEFLKFGTKLYLALIWVLLLLTAEPIHERIRLGIKFRLYHVECYLGFALARTLHSRLGTVEEQYHVSHHPNGLPKRATLVIILSGVLSQVMITDHCRDLQGNLVSFSH